MAAPTVTELTGNKSKSAGTSIAISFSTTAVVVGDYVAVWFGCDSVSGAVSFSLTGLFTATLGTVVVQQDANDGSGTGFARGVYMYALVTGAGNIAQVTITHPSLTARAAEIFKVTGADGTTPILVSSASAGPITLPSSGMDATVCRCEVGQEPGGATTGIAATKTGTSTGWGASPTVDAASIGTTGNPTASNISVASELLTGTAVGAGTIGLSATNLISVQDVIVTAVWQAPVVPAKSLVFTDRRVRTNSLLRR